MIKKIEVEDTGNEKPLILYDFGRLLNEISFQHLKKWGTATLTPAQLYMFGRFQGGIPLQN